MNDNQRIKRGAQADKIITDDIIPLCEHCQQPITPLNRDASSRLKHNPFYCIGTLKMKIQLMEKGIWDDSKSS